MSRPFANITNLFTAQERFYAKNNNLAAKTYARPSLQKTPIDTTEPSVTIFAHDEIRCILPLDDALRLATQIADSIQYHKETAK